MPKQISFESNFNYSSVLLSDFNINEFKIRLTEDSLASSDVLLTTEAVEDLSIFAESGEIVLTHQVSQINYSGALDNGINWLGENYDLVFNPIMLTSSGSTTRFAAFTAQNSTTGEQRRMLYREVFGTNGSATPQFWEYQDDGVEALTPAMQSASNATSSTRFYWINGNGNDPEYNYARFRINGSSNSATQIGDIGGSLPFIETKPNIGATIHSWADTSYTVIGNGSDQMAVIGVNHSGITDDPFRVHKIDFPTSNVAVASSRVEDDLYVVADGQMYLYLGDQDLVQAGDKLDHSGTPGILSPTVVGSYTGYYFTRMFYDAISGDVYLVGGTTATTGQLPATYTSQNIYKTDTTMSFLTDLGSFDVGYYTNQYVFRVPDSQLFMFPGAYVTTMFDAESDLIIDSRQRLQDGTNTLQPTSQLTGAFKTERAATIGYLTIKESPTGLQDYSNSVFQFMTINSL